MRRLVLVLLLLVIAAPAAVLAVHALRAIASERDASLRGLDERLDEEVERLRGAVELRLREASERAEERLTLAAEESRRTDSELDDRPLAFVDPETGELGWTLARFRREEELAPRNDEESRLALLSLRGGEAYEARGEVERAVDAYTFFLPRIGDPVARARLRFRAARAAKRAGNAALARAAWAELIGEHSASSEGEVPFVEDGWPVDVLAALALADTPDDARASPEVSERVGAVIRRRARLLSTRRLRVLFRRDRELAKDAKLARLITGRTALEEALARPAKEKSTDPRAPGTRFDGRVLLAGRETGSGAHRTIAWTLEPVDLPRAALGWEMEETSGASPPSAIPGEGRGYGVEWVNEAGGFAKAEDARAVPIRAEPGGAPVISLRIRDLRRANDAQSILERARTDEWVILAMGLVALFGGAALVAGALRSWRLARLRSRLVANVSHELRTPVTAVRLLAEMLAEDPHDEERTRRFARLLGAESLRLSRLVADVLDVARFGSGRTPRLDVENVDLGELLASIAEPFGCRAEEKGVHLRTSFPAQSPKAPIVARADRVAAERIAANLLDNALKYGSTGGSEIHIEIGCEGAAVWFRIADDGAGVPAGDEERIFEDFYRARFEDHGVQGAGLGLSLARRLARAMKGDLRLERRSERGASFRVTLPGAPQASEPGGPDPSPRALENSVAARSPSPSQRKTTP